MTLFRGTQDILRNYSALCPQCKSTVFKISFLQTKVSQNYFWVNYHQDEISKMIVSNTKVDLDEGIEREYHPIQQ